MTLHLAYYCLHDNLQLISKSQQSVIMLVTNSGYGSKEIIEELKA